MANESNALRLAQEACQKMKEAGIKVVMLDPISKSHKFPTSLRYAINGKCWD